MRFRTSVRDIESAFTRLSESNGFIRGSIARSVDDPQVCVLTMEFADVGAYRKALSRYEIKAEVVPLLSTTLDDITTFEIAIARAEGETTTYVSGHAHDSGLTALGSAAQPQVEPLSHDFR